MTKKRDRNKQPVPLTPVQIQGMAQIITQKMAVMFSEFIQKTGQIIGEVTIQTQAKPRENGMADITQSVSIKYGAPQPAQPAIQIPSIQIERPI